MFVPVTARPFKDWLNIFLNRFNPSRSNGIPIDLERMTNSKRMVFSRSNRYMYALVYVFIRGHNKKEIKNSQIYSWGFDCLFKNEQRDRLNMT